MNNMVSDWHAIAEAEAAKVKLEEEKNEQDNHKLAMSTRENLQKAVTVEETPEGDGPAFADSVLNAESAIEYSSVIAQMAMAPVRAKYQ